MIDDKSLTDTQTKVNIFNIFFTDQSTPLKNNSALPTSQMFLTPSRLCILNFSEEDNESNENNENNYEFKCAQSSWSC